MGNISNEAELKAAIRELELKTTQQEKALKENARATADSLKPANLLKVGLINLKKVAVTRDLRSIVINTFVGLAAGYITRKFFVSKTNNILKRTAGAAVQAAVTKMVFRQLPTWQQKTTKLISGLNHKSRKNHG